MTFVVFRCMNDFDGVSRRAVAEFATIEEAEQHAAVESRCDASGVWFECEEVN